MTLKYKVGDKVQVLRDQAFFANVRGGEVLSILELVASAYPGHEEYEDTYKVQNERGTWYLRDRDVQLFTDAPPAEKAKVSDPQFHVFYTEACSDSVKSFGTAADRLTWIANFVLRHLDNTDDNEILMLFEGKIGVCSNTIQRDGK